MSIAAMTVDELGSASILSRRGFGAVRQIRIIAAVASSPVKLGGKQSGIEVRAA